MTITKGEVKDCDNRQREVKGEALRNMLCRLGNRSWEMLENLEKRRERLYVPIRKRDLRGDENQWEKRVKEMGEMGERNGRNGRKGKG